MNWVRYLVLGWEMIAFTLFQEQFYCNVKVKSVHELQKKSKSPTQSKFAKKISRYEERSQSLYKLLFCVYCTPKITIMPVQDQEFKNSYFKSVKILPWEYEGHHPSHAAWVLQPGLWSPYFVVGQIALHKFPSGNLSLLFHPITAMRVLRAFGRSWLSYIFWIGSD